MRDLYHNLRTTQLLNPQTATTTRTSSSVDLQGFDSAIILFSIGDSGDTLSGSVKWTFKIQESDNNSTFTDVALADLNNDTATVEIDAPTEDTTAIGFGYQGSRRYLRGVATATGTHTNGTPMAITALLSHAAQAPVI